MRKREQTSVCCPHDHNSSACRTKGRVVQSVPAKCSPKSDAAHHIVKYGRYRRKCDGVWVQRYGCVECKITFSTQTDSDSFSMRKIWIHKPLEALLSSGVSKRQSARVLRINKKTVDRKIPFLAKQARQWQKSFVQKLSGLTELQFDDLETYEHTKMKPLSVPLVVCGKRRFILALDVAQMPAKGLLAAKSRKKYGNREDLRPAAWNAVLSEVARFAKHVQGILTDENPHYPKHLKVHFPKANHSTTPGGRGCVAGYGELKKKGFDKMFALNHTCAMLRDHLACLKRRTWTTTKRPSALKLLLEIYTKNHNEMILAKLRA